MSFPAFNTDTGGRQGMDANSRHAFALNAHTFTVTIEATNFGNAGIDFQFAADGKTWASILNPRGPVKRTHCHHFTAATGAYRFVVPPDASGVTCELMTP